MMNAHVLKWYRWKIWVAREQGRLMRMTFLIEWYNEELAKTNTENAECTLLSPQS